MATNKRVVALLAEGVDRNSGRRAARPSCGVALLAEGVDRNLAPDSESTAGSESPSSRRAWIEIAWRGKYRPCCRVALLAEGVDRNTYGYSM